MVMESPSPQCVGREFVRQYYTMLNQAPLHLHRFYSHDSSFVHGDNDLPGMEEKPVMGQQDIHQKIMQLNFRDCHAKIRQVDSHATLGSGVVVQVMGELSNNGQPMRRFMQTFVLAPQSPKKYYVHNDIFRYEDKIFSEEEDEPDCVVESESEEPELILQQGNTNASVQETAINMYYENQALSNGSHGDEIIDSAGTQHQVLSKSPSMNRTDQTQLTTTEVASPKPPVANEDVDSSASPDIDDETSKEDLYDKSEAKSDEESSNPANQSSQPELKTYANIVGRLPGLSVTPSVTSSIASSNPNFTSKAPLQAQQSSVVAPFHSTSMKQESAPKDFTGNTNASVPNVMNTNPRIQRNSRGGMANRNREIKSITNNVDRDEDTSGDTIKERRTGSTLSYPDSQQVFVGNLPHEMNEEELKEFFSQWGSVLDARINSKHQNMKTNNGRVPPNFGFIVFESEDSVKQVLSIKKHILYQDTHRLNVEVKKAKMKGASMMGVSAPIGDMRSSLNDGRSGPGRGGSRLARGGGNRIPGNMNNIRRGGLGNARRAP